MWILIISAIAIGVFLVYASSNIQAGIYLKSFCGAKTSENVLALTFDDGPDGENTPQVLDLLKAHNVKASFFCTGSKAEQHPDIIRRMQDEGHLVGNHSYSHSNFFPLFPAKKMVEDLRHAQTVLEELTGCPVTFFRPPFGVTNPTIAGAIRRLGYTSVGWNIRSLDTLKGDPEKVKLRIIKRLKPGGIVLLHDRMPNAAATLLLLLTFLKENSYKFVRIDELIKQHR